jgi:uncharacterized membrane protein
MLKLLGIASMAMFISCGCDEKMDPVQGNGDLDPIDEQVTYTTDIKPILDRSCIGCHATTVSGADREGAPIGVDYDTYELAKATATEANDRIQAGTMPVAAPLADEEKNLFDHWVKQGLTQ